MKLLSSFQKTGSTLLTLIAQADKKTLHLGASPEPFHSRSYFAELESSETITVILYQLLSAI